LEYGSPELYSHIEKEQEWHKISENIELATDRLGRPIDKGIKESVIALNALGLQTRASCEGHLHHGIKAPWVDVGSIDDEMASEALSKNLEGSAETEEKRDKVRRQILLERKNVLDLLDAFYKVRNPLNPVRLIAVFRLGNTRIINQGYGIQDGLPHGEQSDNLDLFRKEMSSFAEALKERYLADR
jgi:hypothetical protein